MLNRIEEIEGIEEIEEIDKVMTRRRGKWGQGDSLKLSIRAVNFSRVLKLWKSWP